MMPPIDIDKLFISYGVAVIVCYLSNIFVVQTMKETEGFSISTNVFRNVVVTLSEVDTIAVAISGQ